jgi:N-acetylglutamate synthase-like GNAT family acetyltransferase
MSEADYQVRRATVDDLHSLKALWESMRFPAVELERRLTEFQLAETPDGELLGALAMEIAGRHGRLHSEAFNDFALAEPLRQRLWERMQSLATNHGLVRIWAQETAPFWSHNGFLAADPESLKKLPAAWNDLPPAWLTLRLRDEEAVEMSLDKEFVRFKEFESCSPWW